MEAAIDGFAEYFNLTDMPHNSSRLTSNPSRTPTDETALTRQYSNWHYTGDA